LRIEKAGGCAPLSILNYPLSIISAVFLLHHKIVAEYRSARSRGRFFFSFIFCSLPFSEGAAVSNIGGFAENLPLARKKCLIMVSPEGKISDNPRSR
jgi:hypothetical protein